MSEIRIAKLHEDAVLPTRKNPSDAGMDLYAFVDDYHRFLVIPPHNIMVVDTGITVEIPEDCVGLIFPKSRNNHLAGAGVVDESYQGEILVKVVNTRQTSIVIHHGDAIAQLVIVPVYTPEIVETPLDEIHKIKTFRGASGGIVEQVTTRISNPSLIKNMEATTFADPDKTFIDEYGNIIISENLPKIERWD